PWRRIRRFRRRWARGRRGEPDRRKGGAVSEHLSGEESLARPALAREAKQPRRHRRLDSRSGRLRPRAVEPGYHFYRLRLIERPDRVLWNGEGRCGQVGGDLVAERRQADAPECGLRPLFDRGRTVVGGPLFRDSPVVLLPCFLAET